MVMVEVNLTIKEAQKLRLKLKSLRKNLEKHSPRTLTVEDIAIRQKLECCRHRNFD